MRHSLLLFSIALIGCTKPAAEAPPATSDNVERLVVKVSDMTADEERQHEADLAAAEARYAELEAAIEAVPERRRLGAMQCLIGVSQQHTRRMSGGRAKAAAWYRAELESLDVDKLIERGKTGFEY